MGNKKGQGFKDINLLLEYAKFEEAAKAMHYWSKSQLIQFILTYPENLPLLRHEDFYQFWADKRIQLSDKYTFAKQDNLADIDFVIGYIFYLMALNAKAKHDIKAYNNYLGLAIKHDSIHAAQTQLHDLMCMKTDDAKNQSENIAALLNNWHGLATKQGTPGYLLLANGYLHLVKIKSEQKSSDEYDSDCFYLWQNLTLADLSKPYCEASIQNAYFDKGVSLSNAYDLATIDEMKLYSGQLINDDNLKNHAENKATAIFDKLDFNKIKLWKGARSSKKGPGFADQQEIKH